MDIRRTKKRKQKRKRQPNEDGLTYLRRLDVADARRAAVSASAPSAHTTHRAPKASLLTDTEACITHKRERVHWHNEMGTRDDAGSAAAFYGLIEKSHDCPTHACTLHNVNERRRRYTQTGYTGNTARSQKTCRYIAHHLATD